MTLTLSVFFLSALVLFGGFLASGTSVLRGRRHEQRRRERIRAAVDPHDRRRRTADIAPIIVTRRGSGPVTTADRVAALFGRSPARSHISPLPFPAMLGVTLATSLGVGWLAAILVGRVAVLLAFPLWPLACRLLYGFFEHRRTRTLFRQFPDALAMIVRGVRVGISVGDSIRAVAAESAAPTATEFAILADGLTIGVSLEDALRALAGRNNLQEYRFFATAISLQNQTGGRLSETLENLADVIRKRVAVRARGYALAAEARMSALVLAALPFVTFGALLVLSPDYVDFFFDDKTGHMVFAAALFDVSFGMFVMRMLIARALA